MDDFETKLQRALDGKPLSAKEAFKDVFEDIRLSVKDMSWLERIWLMSVATVIVLAAIYK